MEGVPAATGSGRAITEEWLRELLPYRFGLEEITTKVNILREELTLLGRSSPIEHVTTRLKPLDSIIAKAARLGIAPEPAAVHDHVFDIAGVRIVCSFIPDTYRVLEMLTRQPDLTVKAVKDYIAEPKPNGYRSLHLIVEVPVFLSDSVRDVCVEIQLRTVAMDFWASVEHKIYYKYEGDVPGQVREELSDAARVAHDLDERMVGLRRLVHGDQDDVR